MNVASEPIGSAVDRVATWTPPSDGAATFRYVDIGSVDRDSKTVVDVADLPVKGAPSRARQLLRVGDVLVSTVRPNLNAVAMVPAELDGAVGSTGFTVLRARAKRLSPRYLFHWVRSPMFVADMVRKATGASYPAISDRIVMESAIPMPGVEEQCRIADILDKADAIRRKRKEAIALAEELLRSAFLDMFGDPVTNPKGWPRRTLQDLCSPKQWPTIAASDLSGTGFPVFGANGFIGYHSEMNHANPTVLITCRGATCGTINVSPPNCYVTGNAMALDTPDLSSMTIEYLEWSLRLRGLADTITGSAQPQITRQSLTSVQLPVPPVERQERFARFQRSVVGSVGSMQSAALEAEQLFTSLVSNAFDDSHIVSEKAC